MAQRHERSTGKAIENLPVLKPGESAPDFRLVQERLRRFGYLDAAVTPDRLDEPTRLALVRYQQFFGFESDAGAFDEATRERLARSRCAHSDPVGPRAHLAALCFWWPLPEEATFGLGFHPGTLNRAGVIAACQRAFDTWATVLGGRVRVTFVESADVDFLVAWRRSNDADGGLDEDTWGHSDYPSNCPFHLYGRPQPVHLNRDFDWSLGAVVGRRDVESGVLHEIGHLLGLDHHGSRRAVMNPELDSNLERRALDGKDEAAIGLRYP